MSRFPLRQPPAGWHVVHSLDEMTGSLGWFVVQRIGPSMLRTAAGPFTERWYAVAVAERVAARAARIVTERAVGAPGDVPRSPTPPGERGEWR